MLPQTVSFQLGEHTENNSNNKKSNKLTKATSKIRGNNSFLRDHWSLNSISRLLPVSVCLPLYLFLSHSFFLCLSLSLSPTISLVLAKLIRVVQMKLKWSTHWLQLELRTQFKQVTHGYTHTVTHIEQCKLSNGHKLYGNMATLCTMRTNEKVSIKLDSRKKKKNTNRIDNEWSAKVSGNRCKLSKSAVAAYGAKGKSGKSRKAYIN